MILVGGTGQSRPADEGGVTLATVSGLVAELERAGFVERTFPSTGKADRGRAYSAALRAGLGRSRRRRLIAVRIRRAVGQLSNRSGGSISVASPSSPSRTAAAESTVNVGVVHSRHPGNGAPGSAARTPRVPLSIPRRRPRVGRASSS